jgi:hypothetical protein
MPQKTDSTTAASSASSTSTITPVLLARKQAATLPLPAPAASISKAAPCRSPLPAGAACLADCTGFCCCWASKLSNSLRSPSSRSAATGLRALRPETPPSPLLSPPLRVRVGVRARGCAPLTRAVARGGVEARAATRFAASYRPLLECSRPFPLSWAITWIDGPGSGGGWRGSARVPASIAPPVGHRRQRTAASLQALQPYWHGIWHSHESRTLEIHY